MQGELYSLLVDEVGEVLSLPHRRPSSATRRRWTRVWREVSGGIYRLNGALLIVLDVDRLLASLTAVA